MKTIIAFTALIAIALAAPRSSYKEQDGGYEVQSQSQQQQRHIPIVKFESEQTDNAYRYGYESANGIQVAEQGQVKNEGQKGLEAVVAEGYYAFQGTDGKEYAVNYVADENGFRASGAHLPTPPPLPLENQKLIEEVYARPTSKYDEEDYEKEQGQTQVRYQPVQQQQQYQTRQQHGYSQ